MFVGKQAIVGDEDGYKGGCGYPVLLLSLHLYSFQSISSADPHSLHPPSLRQIMRSTKSFIGLSAAALATVANAAPANFTRRSDLSPVYTKCKDSGHFALTFDE